MVGPARPYLRRFDFNEHGRVNPRLWVGVTSLKKKASHEPFSKLPLRRFSYVSLVANKLDDAALKRIAPAFEGSSGGCRTPGQPAPDLSQIANGWVDALCDEPALRNLHVVCLGAAQPDAARLARLKAMKALKVMFTASAPNDLKEVEALEGR